MRTLLQKVVVWNPYDREFVGNVIFQRGRYFFNTVEHCRRRGNTIPRKKRRPEGSCTQNGTVVSYDVPRVVARGAVGHTQQPETPASSTRGHPMLPHCLVPSYECNPWCGIHVNIVPKYLIDFFPSYTLRFWRNFLTQTNLVISHLSAMCSVSECRITILIANLAVMECSRNVSFLAIEIIKYIYEKTTKHSKPLTDDVRI